MADADALAPPAGALAPGGVPPAANKLEEARRMFPVLRNMDLGYVENIGRSDNFLEAWPPGEQGSPDFPRPPELDINKYGLEVYKPDTRPIDILGDVVSHFMMKNDPRIKDTYAQFVGSMTPKQKEHLQEQYRYDVEHEGEQRSFADWSEASGLPAWFRGYAFQQWPKEFTDQAYTPEQRALFDNMMNYLRGQDGRR